jgi:predicted RNase H-like HicB family nuclease
MKPAEYLKRPYSRVVVPEADGSYRGEVLEFPGCIAVGDTAAETLANLEEVAASWLESVIARGQSIPEPLEENEYSGKTVLRLAKSIHQKAARAARRDGVSLNAFIANCVAEQLGARKVQTHHHVTNFSQQNNMVFLNQDVNYVATYTARSSPQASGVAPPTPAARISSGNPWNRNA